MDSRAARAADPDALVDIAFKPGETAEQFTLKGVAFTQRQSAVSGSTWAEYDPQNAQEYVLPFQREMVPAVSVRLPAAYVVRASATEAIARVQAHGIEHFRIEESVEVEADGWRIDDPQWTTAPFEGRIVLRSFRPHDFSRRITLARGSIVVPLDQSAANVAVQLFEPGAPDALLRWGFFNAVFELKEYADARKIEQIARDLLRQRPELQAEFDARLQDPVFAADANARLAFFFMRSPYADPELGVLPVFRIDRERLRQLRAKAGHSPRS